MYHYRNYIQFSYPATTEIDPRFTENCLTENITSCLIKKITSHQIEKTTYRLFEKLQLLIWEIYVLTETYQYYQRQAREVVGKMSNKLSVH